MDDKFILLGLGDENSKDVAEVLGNKTCKKILDFLGDVKEASEKDIADGLNIPINTVEYNLKKLTKSGLVNKSGNFFWSVKGKKIPMYKLARKHIIISPHKNPNLSALKSILPVLAIVVVLAVIVVLLNSQQQNLGQGEQDKLARFSSYAEMKMFLEENLGSYYGGYGLEKGEVAATFDASGGAPAPAVEQARAQDYSQTNIQVEGVDEPDIVKNDGKYIYTVVGNKVVIVNAYPAESMEISSEIEFDESILNIFINQDKLVAFVQDYEYFDTGVRCGQDFDIGIRCGGYSKTTTKVYTYDISNKNEPELVDSVELDGNYVDARMIDNYVYVISSKYIRLNYFDLPVYKINGAEKSVAADEVYYFNSPDENYIFNTIAAINIDNGELETEAYLMGASNAIYVSQSNIYLTYQKQLSQKYYYEKYVEEVLIPVLPNEQVDNIREIMDSDESIREKGKKVEEIFEDYWSGLNPEEIVEFMQEVDNKAEEFYKSIQKETEKTVIHKIKVNELDIEYQTAGEVPGRVLNQFSMDEYNEYFRIATTTGGWDNSLNHLYVLDENLEIIGKVEDLAKGERIYSARFLGERAYMVTFRQVDPLFVIDLSDEENPEVLGSLKVTGYSGYLHPYGENHLLGIGMEATEQGRVEGVKVALFDVSDISNPKEIDKYEITEGEWSNSDAVYDAKAVLFDKEKNLLVIPVSYNKKISIQSGAEVYPRYDYWQGAYVFNVDLEGIDLKGKISHQEQEVEDSYWRGSGYVRRSLFMDDYLYTVSDTKIKANDLETLEEMKEVELPYYEQDRVYYADRGIAESVIGSRF